MAIHNTPEERKVIKLIEKLALPADVRQAWINDIQTNGMSEELAEQIHDRLTTPAEGEAPLPNRALVAVEFSQLVRRWRMSQGARKFR